MYSATWPKPLEKIFPSTIKRKKKKKLEFEDNSFSRIEKNRVKSVEKFFSRRQKPPRRPLLLRVYEARAEAWFSDSMVRGHHEPPRANDGMSMTRNDARRNDARSINQRLGQECQFLSLPLVSLANRSRLIISPSLRAIRPCRVPLSVDKLSTELSIRWLKGSLYLYAKTNSVIHIIRKDFCIDYIYNIGLESWTVLFCKQRLKGRLDFLSSFSIKIETSRLRIFVPAHIFVN